MPQGNFFLWNVSFNFPGNIIGMFIFGAEEERDAGFSPC